MGPGGDGERAASTVHRWMQNGITKPSLKSVCSPIRLTRPGAHTTIVAGPPNALENSFLAFSTRSSSGMSGMSGIVAHGEADRRRGGA